MEQKISLLKCQTQNKAFHQAQKKQMEAASSFSHFVYEKQASNPFKLKTA